ncbi:DUF6542 domain-containing protein [Corynebacterium sp. HS2168-gen11]|uniref:DUF6542 domain-containing protein n=1 Tax=Corynebacterium sp. HS2168-gen11 TaxID=2974027 RepID=UPI00216B0E21|nr:DUF6542 domain-containing protein [Corynebacterium sp. HS2168-gen11]MCS4534960.1 hypothetical protein [Corynebacterium sp. HS2168-gen11]
MTKASVSQSTPPFFGFPAWVSFAILAIGVCCSMLPVFLSAAVTFSFFLVLILTIIFVAVLTAPRALFLVVGSIPFVCAIALVSAGVLTVVRSSSHQNWDFSATEKITMLYPLFQFFPVMLVISLVAAAIAAIRYVLLKRYVRTVTVKQAQLRQQESESNKRTNAQSAQARARIHRRMPREGQTVTVEELLKRTQAPTHASRRTPVTQTPLDQRQAHTFAPKPMRTRNQQQAPQPPADDSSPIATEPPNFRPKRFFGRSVDLNKDLYDE